MIVRGNKNLLETKLVAVLNSSQSKTPCGNDGWIKATSAAVNKLANSGYTIVTSLGLNTWEMSCYLAAKQGGNQVIISPMFDDSEGADIFRKALYDFDLDEQKTAMVFVKSGVKNRSDKGAWQVRDRAVFEIAEKIVPIAIRPGGKIEKLLEEYKTVKAIDESNRIPYAKAGYLPPKYQRTKDNAKIEKWDYIVHWTKTCHGPWPHESTSEFYKKLLASSDVYPNCAFNTLQNILEKRVIFSSSKHIRDGRGVIGFSESSPTEIAAAIRWCPKSVNYNFEPYGIGIHKEEASRLGFRPVIYGSSVDYKKLADSDKPFFQNKGEKNVDWTSEKEWRCIVDFDFSPIDQSKIIVCVWSESEAEYLRKKIVYHVISIH